VNQIDWLKCQQARAQRPHPARWMVKEIDPLSELVSARDARP
jgi:hypothetical protein